MKNIKYIITNLILVLMLVILTSGVVSANDSWDVQILAKEDENYDVESYTIKVLKNGSPANLDELVDYGVFLSNNSALGINFYIKEDGTTYTENCTVTYNPSDNSFEVTPDSDDFTIGYDAKQLSVRLEDDAMDYLLEKKVAVETDYGESSKTGYLQFNDNNGTLSETKIKENKMTAIYENAVKNSQAQKITITPTETAIYTVTVSNSTGELEYELFTSTGEITRLAARYGNKEYSILSANVSDTTTTIDVILEEGVTYELMVYSVTPDDYITVSLEKRNIQKLAMAGTNIPSNVISCRAQYDASAPLQEYNDDIIKIVEFDYDTIKKYINDGIKPEEEINNGGFLEGILTNLLVALGTIFVTIMESVIDANVPLTIDNIIFNRFDQTVIDLNPLGGIQIGTGLSTSGKGIFYDGNVGEIISILYNALKNLALAVYIVMLLYIGVKILLSIGGKDQKKYLKFLEYWVTGLLIFAIFPYFIPAIPATANAIVEMMEKEAKSLNGDYSTAEVLAKLGGDASLLAEDAEVVELQNLIDEKVSKLNEQIDGVPGTREEAQANIDANINLALDKFHSDMSNEKLNELNQKVQDVRNFIDLNYFDWTDQTQKKYEAQVEDVKEYIFDSVETTKIAGDVMEKLPQNVKEDMMVYRNISNIISYIKKNASKWNTSTNYQVTYNRLLQTLKNSMNASMISNEYAACYNAIDQAKKDLVSYATSDAFTNLESLFEDYKDAVIQEEIEELKDMKNKISNDVMTVLKTKAKSENRVVYAIAWLILLYQMIAILMNYYKRVLVTIILVIIFPVVMAFYVIDKSGDGKSQSLSNWLKEFLAIILVQILHAGIYVILINVGIDACNADPDKNWFFLILAVCFLFPGEKILRSILGLESSVIDGVRNNITGTIAGVVAVRKLATNGYRAVKSGIKDLKEGKLPGHRLVDEFNEEEKKVEKKRKRRSNLEKSKADVKKYREQYRAAAQESIKNGTASTIEKLHERVNKAKDSVNNLGIVQTGKNVIASGKKAMSAVRNNNIIKGVSKAARIGKFTLKKGAGVAKKGFGLAMGTVEGIEKFGQGGAMLGLYTARNVAKGIRWF